MLNRDTFIRNCAFVLHMIKASEGLIENAIESLSRSENEYDRIVFDYYLTHLEEEKGHYHWLLNDLESENIAFDWSAAEIAGAQYYLINHIHPTALLGYMIVLECFPVPIHIIEELEIAHGKKLLSTARYHAIHDQDHGKDVLELVEKAPQELKQWIYENAINTAHKIGIAQEKFEDNHAK